MTEKHVTLTLEEADLLVALLETAEVYGIVNEHNRERLARIIRQRWLDALRKESA